MAKADHWLPRLIATANKYDAAGGKFLTDHILAHIVNGRIHAEIRPFRAEEGGTRSSRFSYADPPLQQMPSRDEEIGPLIRNVFLPEEGEYWAKPDLSQQEFRWLAHHAVKRNLQGAKETAKVFHDDPEADFHAVVATMTGLPRGDAKNTNFAKIYGAGPKKIRLDDRQAARRNAAHLAQYDQKLPFVVAIVDVLSDGSAAEMDSRSSMMELSVIGRCGKSRSSSPRARARAVGKRRKPASKIRDILGTNSA